MTILTTGQTLDGNGQPLTGSGFKYESGSRFAQLLNQRTSPIFSRPASGEWFFELGRVENGNGPIEQVVAISRPGNAGPPEHIHTGYDEIVEVVQGAFVVVERSGERRFGAGETFVVEQGKPHSVRAASGDEFAVALIEVRPAATFGILLRNYLGLDHDGKLSPEGVPEFLQAMVHTSTFYRDTVFTTPPPSITIPLAKVLTPVARLAGHQGRNPRYEDDAFWLARVAQPEAQIAQVG